MRGPTKTTHGPIRSHSNQPARQSEMSTGARQLGLALLFATSLACLRIATHEAQLLHACRAAGDQGEPLLVS
jgi:hypothetical protein